jgi:hypothetical protein
VNAPHIADDYDDYFALNSLFEFDEAVLRRQFARPKSGRRTRGVADGPVRRLKRTPRHRNQYGYER